MKLKSPADTLTNPLTLDLYHPLLPMLKGWHRSPLEAQSLAMIFSPWRCWSIVARCGPFFSRRIYSTSTAWRWAEGIEVTVRMKLRQILAGFISQMTCYVGGHGRREMIFCKGSFKTSVNLLHLRSMCHRSGILSIDDLICTYKILYMCNHMHLYWHLHLR